MITLNGWFVNIYIDMYIAGIILGETLIKYLPACLYLFYALRNATQTMKVQLMLFVLIQYRPPLFCWGYCMNTQSVWRWKSTSSLTSHNKLRWEIYWSVQLYFFVAVVFCFVSGLLLYLFFKFIFLDCCTTMRWYLVHGWKTNEISKFGIFYFISGWNRKKNIKIFASDLTETGIISYMKCGCTLNQVTYGNTVKSRVKIVPNTLVL